MLLIVAGMANCAGAGCAEIHILVCLVTRSPSVRLDDGPFLHVRAHK